MTAARWLVVGTVWLVMLASLLQGMRGILTHAEVQIATACDCRQLGADGGCMFRSCEGVSR